MIDHAERKLVRDGLVRITDRVSELLADAHHSEEDTHVLRELNAEVWSLRHSLGMNGGEVIADETADVLSECAAGAVPS